MPLASTDRMKLLGKAALCVAAIAMAFSLDAAVADLFSKPIRSGQVRATLTSLRCWGEAQTLLMVALGISLAIPRKWKQAAIAVVLTLVCAALVEGIKPISGRMRPDEAKVNPEGGTWQARTGRNSSFPSGHTATAFAFGRTLSLMVPHLQPVCLLAATGTAVSRMHEQRHYLSDCVVGALLGWGMVGFLWRRIQRFEGRVAHILPWRPAFADEQSHPSRAEISRRAA